MSEPAAAPSPAPDGETPTQRQARLRRERRQAKIATGGTDRLNKILGTSGRSSIPDAPTPDRSGASTPASSQLPRAPPPNPSAEDAPDPAEMDVSEHYWQPGAGRGGPPPGGASPFDLNALLQQQQGGGGANPNAANDPMLQLMQQLLASGGEPSSADAAAQLPALAQMFGGNPDAAQAEAAALQRQPSDRTQAWRVVHAVAALALALYVVLSSPVAYRGSRAGREGGGSAVGEDFGHRLFVWFGSAEVLLQSTRWWLEKGQLRQGGILGTVAAVAPEPYAGYIRALGRYAIIFQTVATDVSVIVFVLGMVAWWNSR